MHYFLEVGGKQKQPNNHLVLRGRSWNANSPFRLDGTKFQYIIEATNATVVTWLTKPEPEWKKDIEIVNLGPEEILVCPLTNALAAGSSVILHFDGTNREEVSRNLYINKGDFE